MAGITKHVSNLLDGMEHEGPSKESTCPYSEGCKLHLSPGELMRYGLVILGLIFGCLFVFSLFFPSVISHPNISLLHELVDVIQHAIHGTVPVDSVTP